MKKNLLFLTFLYFTTIVFSQNVEDNRLSWGIRAGFDRVQRARLGYHEDPSSALSEFVGVYVKKRLGNMSPLYLQGEFLYKTFSVNSWRTVKTINIEMPLSIKLVQGKKHNFNICAGLAPVIPIGTTLINNYIKSYKRLIYKSPVNLSYFAGIGAQLPFGQNRMGVELRYCRYLVDNYAYETASPGNRGRNSNITNNASTLDFGLIYKIK